MYPIELYIFERLPDCNIQYRFKLENNDDRTHRDAGLGTSLFAVVASGTDTGKVIAKRVVFGQFDEFGKQLRWEIKEDNVFALSPIRESALPPTPPQPIASFTPVSESLPEESSHPKSTSVSDGTEASTDDIPFASNPTQSLASTGNGTPSDITNSDITNILPQASDSGSEDGPVGPVVIDDSPPQQVAAPDDEDENVDFSLREVAFGGAAIALFAVAIFGAVVASKRRRATRSANPVAKQTLDRAPTSEPSFSTLLKQKILRRSSAELSNTDASSSSSARSNPSMSRHEFYNGSNDMTVFLVNDTQIIMPHLDLEKETIVNPEKLDSTHYAFSAKSNSDSINLSAQSKKTLALDMDRLGHKLFPETLATPSGSTLVDSPESSTVDSIRTTTSSYFWNSIRLKTRESKLYSFSFVAGSLATNSLRASGAGSNSVRTSGTGSNYSEWKASDIMKYK
jgi:hypothetical protein